jgi:hypothetical protein
MSRTKNPLLALICIGICGAWIASCSDEESRECVPGITRLCAGEARCEGVQSCLPDGSGYGECDCSPLPRGTGGAPGASVLTSIVGRPCTGVDPNECGAGLECFRSDSNDFFGGGPAGGYCSLPCTNDVECTSIDRQSACVGAPGGGPGLCIRTCLSQDPNAGENKCLNRRDLACNSEVYLGLVEATGQRQSGWCFPQCGSDEDCDGRVCDLARGLCTNARSPGAPIGARCEGTSPTECAGGICLRIGETDRLCSAPCVFGQPVGCGYGPSANPRDAACFAPRVTGGFLGGGEGIGDIGFCVELCSQASDCEQAAEFNWVCSLSQAAQDRLGRPGICNVPPLVDGGVDGGADANGPGVAPDASIASDGG